MAEKAQQTKDAQEKPVEAPESARKPVAPPAEPDDTTLKLPEGVERVSVATGTFESGDAVTPSDVELIRPAVQVPEASD